MKNGTIPKNMNEETISQEFSLREIEGKKTIFLKKMKIKQNEYLRSTKRFLRF